MQVREIYRFELSSVCVTLIQKSVHIFFHQRIFFDIWLVLKKIFFQCTPPYHTCFSTTFGKSVQVNQATSVFLGKKIKWVSLTKASECILVAFFLDAFNFHPDVNLVNGIPNAACVFEKGPKMTSIWSVKVNLMSMMTPKDHG
jgi:hypothetical protein